MPACCLTGESGTGKELLARAIHEASPRRNKPFASINCSAMAENLLESELFGHEKGAFPGATRSHRRACSRPPTAARCCSDEVGDMPMRLQVKLLRVLQENQIRPVGSAEPVSINVRVISATHRDLHQLMVGGQFREDLYYRLNVVHIEMPSLGRRREDIPLLVAHFLEQIAKESGQTKDLRAGGGGAPGDGRVAGQRAAALQRGAAERRLVAWRHHHRGTRAAIARRQSDAPALLRRGAR